MTQQQETRFKCDRCGVDISVPLNDMPAQKRGAPPANWVTLWIDDTTIPSMHLCPTCAPKFGEFMRNPT